MPVTKSDQGGERESSKDPRHVYANPLQPEICPILSLAMYFATYPEVRGNVLFPGRVQDDRFSKQLAKVLAAPELNALLVNSHIQASDIGTHSCRKGASTYVSSGSTAGPSIVAVCLRCGWKLGDVQDRYLRYERAGDQFVGRTVCGLPLCSTQFATLPPHFTALNDTVKDAITTLFPYLSTIPSMMPVLCLALASLVWHSDWIRANVHRSHPVRSTYLLRTPALLQSLKCLVTCGIKSPVMTATGIPPVTDILVAFGEVVEKVGLLISIFTRGTLLKEILDGVDALLEEKGVRAGNVTPDSLRAIITGILDERGLTSLPAIARAAAGSPSPGPAQLPTPANGAVRLTSTWVWANGDVRNLPENFVFPKLPLYNCWELWLQGKIIMHTINSQ